MKRLIVALGLTLVGIAPATAQVSAMISSGPVSIGINVPVYPQLVPVPGYPVYYAPGVGTNFFFYDGLYWVFNNGGWYQSQWYNGPWFGVPPDAVPVFLLRVPVRYYRYPPAFFRGWNAGYAPHWDEHWGHAWAEHHADWNHWDRAHAPRPAPLPTYQRAYSGARYPHDAAEAARMHENQYRYQPHDQVVQQHYQQHREMAQRAPQAYDQRGQHYEQHGQQHSEQHAQQPHDQRGGQGQGQGHEHGQGQGHEGRGGGDRGQGGGG
jgi:hypothetical protein